MDDLISRQAAIEAIGKSLHKGADLLTDTFVEGIEQVLEALPSAQHTLYGYRIEHLAYIARVMEKEGVTAEYAVKTFDDFGRALKMIQEETQKIVWENMYSSCLRFEPYEGEGS